MTYTGGKHRIGASIARVAEAFRKPGQWWVEPFCGSCGVLKNVKGPRIAADAHAGLIALWNSAKAGWVPPTDVSEDEYHMVKTHRHAYPPQYVAFVGFCCSFAGKYFGGYARNNRGDEYAAAGSRSIRKISKVVQGVAFVCCSYENVPLPDESLIYCDPPYTGTTGYSTGKFDHEAFFTWCRAKSRQGHTVLLSEYSAPEDFILVWEKARLTATPLRKGAQLENDKRVEKLFLLPPRSFGGPAL